MLYFLYKINNRNDTFQNFSFECFLVNSANVKEIIKYAHLYNKIISSEP